MEKLLTIWPAYAPAAFFLSLGLAMRTVWGPHPTRIVVWIGRVVFAVMGIIWELTTDSPLWVRLLNGVFAALVVSVGFSKILEALCSSQRPVEQSATASDSQPVS
jgi:steroid 5-alpha reductase family enzyme